MTVGAGVKVYPLPVAKFACMPDSASIRIPRISFNDESSFTEKWEWNYGDNSEIEFGFNPFHVYKDTGTYQVRLITTSDQGCIDTTFRYVRIKEDFGIYIPNAFTPNNDNVNDFFTILGLGIKDFEMFIYDRWGIQIFNSSEITRGWDGRVQSKGTQCPSDVYVYKVHLIDNEGISHNYMGRVTLVR
jgi:gliding motility-associated-like protein